MNPGLQLKALVLFITLLSFSQNSMAICLPSTVSTFGNETEVTTCPSDGVPDIIKFKRSNYATAYRWIITDGNGTIIGFFQGNSYDFELLGGGVSYVYGLSFSGTLDIPLFENIQTADFGSICWTLSANYVTVNRVIPDGGNVSLNNGDLVAYTCPDGNPDLLTFTNTNASIGNYAYIITDANDLVVGYTANVTFDFEGLPEGSCFVYGMAYAGELTINIGDDINVADLSDSCFDISDEAVEVFKDMPEGGTIFLSEGGNEVTICVGDGQSSVVSFDFQNSSNSYYAYLITDENSNLISIETGDSYDFEGLNMGNSFVYGIAYTGSLTGSDGVNIFLSDLSDDCFSISTNFITINRLMSDGGEVETIDGENLIYICPGNGILDTIFFQNNSSADIEYGYVITNTDGDVLEILDGTDFFDFENSGEGICRVYGVSYFEEFSQDTALNIFTSVLADDCYELSSNFVEVIRALPDAGATSLSNGEIVAFTCPGNGSSDSLSFTSTGGSQSKTIFAVTNEAGEVLEILTGNTFDFESSPEGICYVYQVAFTGNFMLMAGDTLATTMISDDCYDYSDQFVTVNRALPDGGEIETANGLLDVFTCPGNGNADIVEFSSSNASNSEYAFVLVTTDSIVVEVTTNGSFDFENQPIGSCQVLGVAYTGNILIQVGDDMTQHPDFSDDCFDFAENVVTVHKVIPEGGSVSFQTGGTTASLCAGDGNADVLLYQNMGEAAAPYIYIVTDSNGVIVANTLSLNFDFETIPEAACRLYGLSFTGVYEGVSGDTIYNAALSNDCFDLSDNFLEISKTYVNTGDLMTTNGETYLIICPGDGMPNIVEFENTSDAQNANYQYIITNNQGVITAIPSSDSHDFDPLGVGISKVYGVSYYGILTAEVGSNITMVSSDDCYAVSDNFIEIVRDQPSGDIIVSDLGDVATFCVDDGNEDIINFVTGSFSFANYAYVITDTSNLILGVELESFHDFEGAGAGICRVWGISYTGNLTAGEGNNLATDVLSDDCFDLSANFITINRIVVEGSTIFTLGNLDTLYTCPGDGSSDFVGLFNNSDNSAAYKYIVTDNQGLVIDVASFNLINFENYPEGTCRIYGMSHTGDVEIDAGEDIFTTALTDGCYDLSDNFITVIKVNPEGGVITTFDDQTNITIIIDGISDLVQFVHTGSVLAKQRYVITDENGIILDITDQATIDFELAGEGICRAYNLVYTGNIQVAIGDLFLEEDPTTSCWAISDNFVTITRIMQSSNLTNNSNGVHASNVGNTLAELQVYPNPVSDLLKINFTAQNDGAAQVQVIDLAGKVVFNQKVSLTEGFNQLELPVSKYQNGLYFCKVTFENEEKTMSQRFLKH